MPTLIFYSHSGTAWLLRLNQYLQVWQTFWENMTTCLLKSLQNLRQTYHHFVLCMLCVKNEYTQLQCEQRVKFLYHTVTVTIKSLYNNNIIEEVCGQKPQLASYQLPDFIPCTPQAVIKGQRPGITLNYFQYDLWLLSQKTNGKRTKEHCSCLIPSSNNLTLQLEILVTALTSLI